MGEERVARGKLAIEHVMPRKWQTHWPHNGGTRGDMEREALIHTTGNLTLLTSRLNSKVSNGPWVGEFGKRRGLDGHSVLFLNRDLLKTAETEWTNSAIRKRSEQLANVVLEIWPAPEGYQSGFTSTKTTVKHRVDLADLISAGCIDAGALLYPGGKKYSKHVATLLSDGRLDIDGTVYATPSHASRIVTGRPTNGWSFFLVERKPKRTLRDVRSDYLDSISADGDDDTDDETEQ